MAQPIPEALSHLVMLNIEYSVLICLGNGCKHALKPTALSRHMDIKHKTPIVLRKQLDQYVAAFPFVYDHTSIILPSDGLAPQPVIPTVDGFVCKDCLFKSVNRSVIRQHANKAHSKRRVADKEICQAVRLQSWFGEKRERYWIVDESKQATQDCCNHSAAIQDTVRLSDKSELYDNRNNSQEEIDDYIEADIEKWKAEVQERQLEVLKDVPVFETDSWHRYTGWNKVLSRSNHNMIKTFGYTQEPNVDDRENEARLNRVMHAWSRILERCLDTLAGIDQKDILKWWASPKNEAASQRPFELPQNAETITKYSRFWEGMICYMMRTAYSESWEDKTVTRQAETGVQYTYHQWETIRQIWEYLESPEGPADDCTESRDQEPDITNTLMCLCMLVVMQDTSRISLYESPMMHYLAVRGIDPQSKSLRSAFHYTPLLAGMLWINRLIMLEVAVPLEAWPELGLESKTDMESIPDRIHKLRRKHLCEGSFSPTASVLSQLAMGKYFNKIHQSPANIHWADDEQTIYYLGRPVVLGEFQKWCWTLISELQGLIGVLILGPDLPTIDLSSIVDSMSWSDTFRRQNYSFIEHVQNRDRVGVGYRYLLDRARKGEGGWKLLQESKASRQVEWVDGQVKAYLTQERQFLRKLMVCMHITGGQPARGPELGSIKVSNGIYSARNIYVINGRMCFLTMYDKARKRRDNTEYIIRCLPDKVGQILCQYLVYVRPFARALDRRESEYLFADTRGPWAGEQLSRELSEGTAKHLGVRLPTSGYRQVAIGIATRKLMRAGKAWESEGLEDEVNNFAEGDDEGELELDMFRHTIVRYAAANFITTAADDVDRQAGHGRRVAQAHYAIDGQFLHRLGPELITAYEQASLAWHGLWGLGRKGVVSAGHRRDASQQLVPISPARRVKSAHSHSQAMVGLQCVYQDPNAQPRSEGQAAALELVHNPSPKVPLIIVLPTGSGKSALFLSVAATCNRRTVIVVVPFAALVADIIARGRAAGLECEEWLDRTSGRELQQLIIVSADRAVCGEFLHYAKGLELKGELAHVFFDECHVAFTDTSYRERLRELWTLRYLGCPFTGLTATLMVQLEPVLKERLCIDNAIVFRRSTARRTIRYQVIDSKEEPPSSLAARFVQQVSMPVGKRGIVYVRSYPTGTNISTALQCPFYKARADNKGELLQEWAQGPGGWIVATGALGTGINIEGIVYVVHVDRPYGLTSFAQQSGRGGRGGEVSDSIIITRVESSHGRNRSGIMSEYSVEQIDEDAMTEFIQAKTCRRQVLSRYFDRSIDDIDCYTTDSILCDQCKSISRAEAVLIERADGSSERRDEGSGKPAQDPALSGVQIIARRLKLLQESQESMIKVMDRLQGRCVYCELIQGGRMGESISEGLGSQGQLHTYSDCFDAEADRCGFVAYEQWREGVDLGEFQHCWKCGLSQDICRRMEDSGWCEYPDIMLPGIFILHQRECLATVVEAVGFQGSYSNDIWEWFKGTAEGFGGKWESNWMKTWRGVCRTYISTTRRE